MRSVALILDGHAGTHGTFESQIKNPADTVILAASGTFWATPIDVRPSISPHSLSWARVARQARASRRSGSPAACAGVVRIGPAGNLPTVFDVSHG